MHPLVTRPPYGEGRPATPVAESGLPTGDPGGKGLSLDDDIPGTSTFNKPEGDIREFDKAEPGSIYRKDGPDDYAKPQDDRKKDERPHDKFTPTYAPPGGRPSDDPAVTKYPYRDGRPHTHYAGEQAHFVAGLYQLRFAKAVVIKPGGGMTRTAARMDDMLRGLNPKTTQRANRCSVQVKRVDTGNLRWLFAVNCGNGPKVVKVKAEREGNIVKLTKMELHATCSCQAWQWTGPEYHAKKDDYIDGRPRGTASTPNVKDPERQNLVCKHVAAVLGMIRGWEVPLK